MVNMGLLGDSWDDPRSGAVMALAGGLLKGDFGGGLLGANDAFRQAKQDAFRQRLMQMQMEESQMKLDQARREQASQQGLTSLMPQYFKPGTQGMGGTGAVNSALPPEFQIGAQPALPAQAPTFDVKGYTAAALNKGFMNPLEAMKLQQALAKETPINKLDVKDFTPASVQKFAQTGNYGDLVRLDKLHFADTGGAVQGLDPFTGKPVGAVPKTGNPFSDLVLSDGQGGVRPNTPLVGVKKDIAHAGAARTNVSVDAAPKAFWSDFGKSASDALFKEREAAQAATSVIQRVGEIRKAAAGGAYQGAGAEMKLGAAKALNAMGASFDANTIANTEVFNANAKQFVLAQIKTLGANPSNADREFIEKTVPSLSTDPKALPRLLDFMEGKARQQVQGFNSKMRGVQKQPNAGFMPFSLEVPEPAAPTPAAAASAPGWSIREKR